MLKVELRRGIDVTDIVRREVRNGGLRLHVTNEKFTDPAPGAGKTLHLEYLPVGHAGPGGTRTVRVREGGFLETRGVTTTDGDY